MPVSKFIKESINKSSWIRKMFEEGIRLKKEFGEENVYDFSLGNPDLEPPQKFFEEFKKLATERKKGSHGYMPNAGYPDVRETIAKKVSREHGQDIPMSNIVMTVGAAGALNTIFKTILDPQDEIIIIKPYFVEYNFYVTNHCGVPVHVESSLDFSLNIDGIRGAITGRTRAVLINSPNNPTGKIYSEDEIKSLSEMLSQVCAESGRIIYLVSDEPYRDIVYDGLTVPSIFEFYENSIIATSYSKSLSIPGERIGYIAVSSRASDSDTLMAGLILSNRILGYVNAPALMQRIVSALTETAVDVEAYKARRDIFAEGLKKAGYSFVYPEGAFYIFCKCPGDDDVDFVRHLQKYNILAVPGSGFGGPGYFRLAYCVNGDVIKRAIPKFKEALDSYKKRG